MSRKVIRTIVHSDGKRRVDITQRLDGNYSFEEWCFSDDPLEMIWLPNDHGRNSICDSQETAEREALGRIAWLNAQGRKTK